MVKNIESIHDVLIESHAYMKNDMKDHASDYDALENKIKERYSKFIE